MVSHGQNKEIEAFIVAIRRAEALLEGCDRLGISASAELSHPEREPICGVSWRQLGCTPGQTQRSFQVMARSGFVHELLCPIVAILGQQLVHSGLLGLVRKCDLQIGDRGFKLTGVPEAAPR